jgi:glycerophosphoryl diester phosphodiesterase
MLIVSHRCLGFEASENSLRGFIGALGSAVDQIEIDLRLTLDNRYVALHLPYYFTRKGKVRLIARRSFQKARQDNILTLDEILDAYSSADSSKILRLEVKVSGQERELVQILENRGLINQVVIASWSLTILQKFAQINSALSLSYSFLEGVPLPFKLRRILNAHPNIRSICIVPLLSRVFPKLISRYVMPGCQLFIVSSPANSEITLLEASGVDGIFSQNPQALINARS